MKTRLFVLLLAVSSAMFVGCSDNDDDFIPDDVVVNSFNTKYPDAKRVSWETKDSYKVADFVYDNKETEAWYDAQGKWYMTETDISFDQLPVPIQEAFVLSQYSGWKVDDVDMIERFNTETIYVIEVEKGKEEIDLYYTADGLLVKEVAEDTGKPHLPLVITEAVEKFLNEKYAGAKILEYDIEKDGIEVDIIYQNIHKEVRFNTKGEWVKTEWDVRKSDVTPVVLTAIEKEYPGYDIDDIEIHESPSGLLYVFELEKGNEELKVYVTVDGVITDSKKD